MNLIKLIPAIVGGLFKSETPEVGKKLQKVGKNLFLGGAGMSAAVVSSKQLFGISLPELIELNPDFAWAVIIVVGIVNVVAVGAGAALYFMGKSQTKGNPDNEIQH